MARRPRHKISAESRAQVFAYARVGVPHHQIASIIGCATRRLLKLYEVELETGKASATAEVGKCLFANATRKNNVTAQIFWMKCHAGWREARDPVPVPGQVSATLALEAQAAGGEVNQSAVTQRVRAMLTMSVEQPEPIAEIEPPEEE